MSEVEQKSSDTMIDAIERTEKVVSGLVDFNAEIEKDLADRDISPEMKTRIAEKTMQLENLLMKIYQISNARISNEEKREKVGEIFADIQASKLLEGISKEINSIEKLLQDKSIQVAKKVQEMASVRSREIDSAISQNIELEREKQQQLGEREKDTRRKTAEAERGEMPGTPKQERHRRGDKYKAKEETTRHRRADKYKNGVKEEIDENNAKLEKLDEALTINDENKALAEIERGELSFFGNLGKIFREGKENPEKKMKFFQAIKAAWQRAEFAKENNLREDYNEYLDRLYEEQVAINAEMEICEKRIDELISQKRSILKDIAKGGEKALIQVKKTVDALKSKVPNIREFFADRPSFLQIIEEIGDYEVKVGEEQDNQGIDRKIEKEDKKAEKYGEKYERSVMKKKQLEAARHKGFSDDMDR